MVSSRDGFMSRGYKFAWVGGRAARVHRLVAALLLGRPLRRDEDVHHIDGNRGNNLPENLMVLSRSEHSRLHSKYNSLEEVQLARKDSYRRWYYAHLEGNRQRLRDRAKLRRNQQKQNIGG